MTRTPVVFFVYNRMSTTARVFEAIAAAQPSTLLIVADGPHPDRPDDARKCQEIRDLVTKPTWPCTVHLNLADTNLGFKKRIASGLQWAFELAEEAIVIEDDTLPAPDFFPFCDEMLARYRDDARVMMVTGCNFQFGRRRGDASYYFAHGVGTWGWASWRRAMQHFDPDLSTWGPEAGAEVLGRIWPIQEIADYWRDRINEAARGDVDAWDYQWAYSMWREGGLQLAPNSNLVTYIGCVSDTAHTTDPTAPFCNVPSKPLDAPLVHPADVQRNLAADLFEFYRTFYWMDEQESDRRSAL